MSPRVTFLNRPLHASRQIGSLPVLLKPLAAGYNGRNTTVNPRNTTVNPRNPFPLIFTTTSTNIDLENHHLLEAL